MVTLLKGYGWAALCGVALAISFPTWHVFPLAWVALIPLFVQAVRLEPGAAAKRFFIAGWIFHSVLLQWLMANIYWAGGWAVCGYQFVCVYMALYWGLFGFLWTWMHRRSPRLAGALAAAVMWAAMEQLQATLLTGFGWSSLAYSQGKDLLLLQWAALGGGTLVSAFLVLFAALAGLAYAERSHRVLRAGAAVCVLIVAHWVGLLLIDEPDYDSKPFQAGIVQADFPLEMKWDREYPLEMVRNAADKSRKLARSQPVDLFVWPEALVVEPFDERPELFEPIAALTQDTGVPLFTGADRVNAATNGYRNSSALVSVDGAIVDFYDKVHLAPFGEYTPLADLLPFVGKIVPAIGDMEPGDVLKALEVGERRFGPLICFEVLFSDLAEELRSRGADFLIVITNLGWFGQSNAIPEELEIARVRAVETRLPLVHCANTGISGVFDPWGRFQAADALFDSAGHYVQFKDVSPRLLIMQRCVGALPVAAPGPRPTLAGAWLFPRLAVGASCLLVALVTFLSKRSRSSSGTAAVPARDTERMGKRHG